ncbi:MAG: hypothetical protein AB1611_09415 [bacterium]
MTKVKGTYRGNTIELLGPVKAKDGVEVEVIFPEARGIDQSFMIAMKQELERMDKGIRLGGGPYYQSRDELHE